MTQIPEEGYKQGFNRSYSYSGQQNKSSQNDSNSPLSSIDVSKSPTSKNLAHVPCKFFKQGACQAGSSCPFSHTIDSTIDTAPCKYFQKGNCRFGLKCALAHILPDGRRVNPKSLAQVYKSQQQQQQVQSQMNMNGLKELNIIHNGMNGYGTSANSGVGSLPINYYRTQSTSTAISPVQAILSVPNSLVSGPSTSFVPTTTSTTAPTGPSSPFDSPIQSQQYQSRSSFCGTSPLMSNIATSPFGSSIWSTDVGKLRSLSHSNSVNPGSRPLFAETINESAIMDDDEDTDNEHIFTNEDDDEDSNDVYEEDFVPSSLSDLLTPQELKRRGSRPGSSGVRPTFYKGSIGGRTGGGTGEVVEDEMQFKLEEDWLHG